MHFLGHAERDGRITAIQLDEIERAGPNLTSQGSMDHVLAEGLHNHPAARHRQLRHSSGLLTKATNGIVDTFVIGATCEPDFRWGGVKSLLLLLEHPTPPTS